MAELKTNYVDDKLNVVENTDRVFNLIDKDGNVIYTAISLIEITKYLTVGSQFGADDINAMTVQINANTTDIEELKKGGDGKGIAVKTYAEWQTMTPEQRNNGAYYVPDYPVGYTIGDVIDKVDDIQTEVDTISQNLDKNISKNNEYCAVMQGDGNFVVYNNKTDSPEFATNNPYSLDESNTFKRWIDGRFIYRKIYQITSSTTQFTLPDDIHEITDVYGIRHWASNNISSHKIPYYISSSDFAYLYVENNDKKMYLVKGSGAGFTSGYACIEYTKNN